MTDTAITKQQAAPLAELGPMQLMQQALSSGTSPEVIRELVALQQSVERFNWEREERQSKIDFDNALNNCQSQIERVAPNHDRENGIKYLDYAGADRVVRPIYIPAGFSISFSEVECGEKGMLRMCATLSRGGISREYFTNTSTAPANSKMTLPDAYASASSRSMRYLLLKIFNIAVGIDKDEKKPFENGKQPGELDEREHLTHIDNIRAAGDVKELQRLYMAAQKAADAVGDTKSTLAFSDAKNKRYRELQAKGRI